MKNGRLQGHGRANLNETPRSNNPLFSIGLALLLLVLAVVMVPRSAQAATVAFTSTADFDGGTYTSSAGNRETNSNSCNLGIAAGAFELDSLKGDSFCIDDADADTFKWNLWTSPTPPTVNDRSVASGVLHLDLTAPSALSGSGIVSATTFTGLVDFRVKTEFISSDAGGSTMQPWFEANNEAVSCFAGATGTVDGVEMRILRTGDAATHTVQTWRCSNGALAQQGTNSDVTGNVRYLRILNETARWVTYYSTDGSSWIQDEIVNFDFSGGRYVLVQLTINAGVSFRSHYHFDDFHLAAGTVGAGGFRSSGTWTSATQTYTGEVPSQITVTYSGASATATIDAVSIRDSAGNQLFLDDTDRTSGTSAVITVPYSADLAVDWAARVVLAGNGAGTATIESVSVETEPPPSNDQPPGRTLRVAIACAYNPFTLTWSCADHTNYTGFVPENFDRMVWIYDGVEVASVQERGGVVAFRAPGTTWLETESDHQLVVTWNLRNGGTPSSTVVLHVDNRLAQVGMSLLAIVLFALVIAAIIRARGGAIAYEPVRNPAYRRSSIQTEEYPKGWRSYTQVRHRADLPTRSERRGDLWVLYQVRPATAAEQARTGKKRIGYVQAVREKM